MVTQTQRQELHQLPREDIELFWKQLEASDWNDHPECGFVPTGETCYSCGKKLGGPLPKPYSYQNDYLEDGHMITLLAGGEQGGKSLVGARKTERIILAFLGEHQDRAAGEVAWIVANSYELTSREFTYILNALKRALPFKITASRRVDPGEIRIKVPGGEFIIKTRSANDAETLRAESPVVTLVCEASTLTFDAFKRLRTRVARSRATFPGYGAILMTSTFEGSWGWYPALWTKWQSPATQEKDNVKSFSMPSGSNIFVFKGGMDDPELNSPLESGDISQDEHNERILAIPSPPSGLVHARFDITVHVQKTEYDPDLPVLIGIDPGYSGQPSSYAVEVVQRRHLPCGNRHYWLVDEIFEWKKHPEQIIQIAQNRFWWKNPAKTAVIDIAGRQHGGGMESNKEIWLRLAQLPLLDETINILPGIRRMDALLNICPDPKCGEPFFVIDNSAHGIRAEFGAGPHPHDGQVHAYRWALDRENKPIGKNPQDKYCDGIKAVTYLMINQVGHTNALPDRNSFKQTRHKVEVLA